MRHALVLTFVLLAGAFPAGVARAHDCSTWLGSCAFSDVRALGGAAATRVHEPAEVAAAADGRVAVADAGAHRLLVLDPAGAPLFTVERDHVLNSVTFGTDGDLWASTAGRILRFGRDGALKAEITAGLLRGAVGNQHHAVIHGIAIDPDGRLFAIADDVLMVYGADGRLEREVTRGTAGGFSRDWLIASSGAGRVLVSNLDAGRVEELDATGRLVRAVTDLPAGAWGPGSDVDSTGRLHVGGTSEIWVYDAQLAKTAAIPHGLPNGDGSLAVTSDALVMTDRAHDRLLRVGRSGQALEPWGTDPGTGLNRPEAVEVTSDGLAVVADARNHRVVRFDAGGGFDRVLRDFGPDGQQTPLALALTPAGDVVVTYDSGLVERLGPDGGVRAAWQVEGSPLLRGAATAPDGSVWLRDRSTLLRYTPDGTRLARIDAGLPSTWAAGNGLAVDPAGNLYAATPGSIRKLAPDGQVLGEFEAQLAEGVEVLANGMIAVAAQREVKLMGSDGRLVASWGDHGTPVGHIHLPFDVAVDGAARVYVADRHGQKLVRFTFKQPDGSPAAQPVPPPAPRRLALRITTPRRGLVLSRTGSVSVRLHCAAGGPRCRGSLRLRRRIAARAAAARPPVTLGVARFALRSGRSATMRVRLRTSARRALRAAGRLRVAVLATAADGTQVRRALLLRAR